MNEILFGVYPYVAVAVFIVGSVFRYNTDQYGWSAHSSQFLDSHRFGWMSNVFHVSILLLVCTHILGLLTPAWLYEYFISPATKQLLAIYVGGSIGLICFVAITQLVVRRLFNPRIRLTSKPMDIAILLLLYFELILGIASVPFSFQHRDGTNLAALATWAQHIVTLQPDAVSFIIDRSIIFKVHIFLGMTIFLLLPFSRLVHFLSLPLGYLFQSYTQIVRRR